MLSVLFLGIYTIIIFIYYGRTGDSRGFAFVRYKYADEAQKAVERLDGSRSSTLSLSLSLSLSLPSCEHFCVY